MRSKSCAVALESDERLARCHYSDVGDDYPEEGVESGCVVKVRILRIWSAKHKTGDPIYKYNAYEKRE